MSLKSLLVLLIIIVVFALLIVWIAKQGGWQNEGCSGNCASCQAKCESKQTQPAPEHKDSAD